MIRHKLKWQRTNPQPPQPTLQQIPDSQWNFENYGNPCCTGCGWLRPVGNPDPTGNGSPDNRLNRRRRRWWTD